MSRSLSSNHSDEVQCVVDRNVLNGDTVHNLTDMGLSVFAPLCGRNRGAFVLDPPDGNTYGCVSFPESFAQLAGVESDVNVTDSNSIKENLQGGNITGSEAVDLIDLIVKNVYGSTANVNQDPYACDLGGLAVLECGKKATVGDGPIRSVTLAGVFTPAPWATGGKTLTVDEAKEWYTADDFEDMKTLGLNTVQIPVPLDAFAADDQDESVKNVLSDMLKLVKGAGLKAIVVLKDTDPDEDAVVAAATFASSNTAILALTLPAMESDLVTAARTAAPDLALFVPANTGQLRHLHAADDNVFAALDMPHSVTVGDIASSTSKDDRMKLFYHEAVSCVSRSPIEYAACYRHMPVFIANGFDLSIDDCVKKGDADFKDYGQCDRFEETEDSGWWERHRQSFAERQVFVYELGLGWSFATWKLYGNDDKADGVIDNPAKLLSLKDVAAAGLMPSLKKKSPAKLACLNAPEPDFLLGDETAAPTPGPPPDCGNGWWNFETEQCDYWVPPTPAPTKPCNCPAALTNKAIAVSATSGAVAALVFGAIGLKIFGGRRQGYTTLPP